MSDASQRYVPISPKDGDDIRVRIVKAEINAIMMDHVIEHQAKKVSALGEGLLGEQVSLDKKTKDKLNEDSKALKSIADMHRSLLSSTEGFRELTPMIQAVLFYLAQRTGYVGVMSMTDLWEAARGDDARGMIRALRQVTFLDEPTRGVLIELLREVKHG